MDAVTCLFRDPGFDGCSSGICADGLAMLEVTCRNTDAVVALRGLYSSPNENRHRAVIMSKLSVPCEERKIEKLFHFRDKISGPESSIHSSLPTSPYLRGLSPEQAEISKRGPASTRSPRGGRQQPRPE
jgi:hypothetical protein